MLQLFINEKEDVLAGCEHFGLTIFSISTSGLLTYFKLDKLSETAVTINALAMNRVHLQLT
ncbi:hypothetical protein T4B_4016 [Trichinella pseudospiralis]|uniref:Uncharacterized protein n=2 Tax=Trichinella pseudospiralis TaxID=6337 RepID=A0A0V1EHZ7_TRIPS|nr:hypothetical protein T4A_6978 [Trichinella pseudospiralis]KRY89498.1 hypothetical protein T4D_3657 [Trichinella pseudospiralis]KRZ24319.1 hypothetical protein T4B_4016 [Trichinella pseudospiralis]KRZ41920.1 hypothetical protein T4C_8831 [Trichinella pseudospiralis]